jgi:HPt (histidine-containing phosphotransfer) domain-containing protein
MGEAASSPLAEAMNRLWAKYLPQMEARVATLESAAAGLASGRLSSDERQRASADAHKLAGVLGTFGLKEGTELAREAEELYGSADEFDEATIVRVSLIAEQLKAMVSGRTEGS